MTATPTRTAATVTSASGAPAPTATAHDGPGPARWMWLALLGFVFGTVSLPWDIANHVENIRDSVLYPAHIGLLMGLGTWAVAGTLAVVTRPEGVPLRARRGGLLCAVGGLTAFASFPLDAAWHELFGIDVTLWGPTHLVMMLGGAIAGFGIFTMVVDQTRGRGRWARVAANLAVAIPMGTMMSYLLEFAFDVPQFSLLYPTLISTVAVGIGLVMARALFGPGGAIIANVAFLVMSAVVVNTWLAALDYNTTHVRLMLPAAIAVELAFWLAPKRHAAWVAGALAGIVGTLGEWGWNALTIERYPSEVLAGTPWIWPAAAVLGGVSAGWGAWIARTLSAAPGGGPVGPAPARRSMRWLPAAGAAVVVALLALPMLLGGDDRIDVRVTADEPDTARTTFTLRIADSALEDVHVAEVVSNHGGDFIAHPLERVAPDTYRTTTPSPIEGDWFTSLRLMRTNEIQGLVLRAPGGSIYGDAVDLVQGEQRTRAVDAVPTAGHPVIVPVLAYVALVLLSLAALALARWALLPERTRATV